MKFLPAAAIFASSALFAAGSALAVTVLDLQKQRREETIPQAKLVNLNAGVNVWYLLEVTRPGAKTLAYNLWNAMPEAQTLRLDKAFPNGIVIEPKAGPRYECKLWNGKGGGALADARAQKRPYAQLCEGRIQLKSAAEGHQSFNEWCSDVLRQYLPGGEGVITFVKNRILQDKEMITADANKTGADEKAETSRSGPLDALIAKEFKGSKLPEGKLGLKMTGTKGKGMAAGRWYPSASEKGVFVSQVEPTLLAPEVKRTYAQRAGDMNPVEEKAIVYLVAFDLKEFSLGYAVGSKHPGVEWSTRSQFSRSASLKGGPDGFGSVWPLVTNGTVSPSLLARTIATFTGGFKRYHSAFKMGPFAEKNLGSHYGFIEDGVVMSKPNAGLSTMIVRADGGVEMKTWSPGDDKRLGEIRYARQNGVPIVVPLDIEADADVARTTKLRSKPGMYVNQWGQGNWSGDMNSNKRTLRTGACMQTVDGAPYLVFAYFSAATPTAMARVFQAYRCDYAMHLDMNLPEHSYMSLFHREGADYRVEHLTKAMSAFDQKDQGHVLPRFIAVPDSRDFFFVYRR